MREAASLCLAVALVLALAPSLDVAASSLFFDGARFPLSGVPLAEILRESVWSLAVALFLACAVTWALSFADSAIARREWGWGALVFLLGPGLLVNGVLKEFWGRARPRDAAPFGGEAAFTPWWRPASECASNCSFVSGEASAAAAVAAVLWVWLSPHLPRAPLAAALLALAATTGLLRIAKGAHYLSDVLMAWALTAALALMLRAALGLRGKW